MNTNKILIWVLAAVALAGLVFLVTRPAGPVMKDIGNADAQRLISEGVRLVDVRTPEEYATGHLPGSENIPIEQLPQAASAWDRDEAVLLYCATGSRSANGAIWMAQNGFREVYNLKAGIVAWDGETTTQATAGVGKVPTNGKPVFIEFSSNG